MWLPRASDYDRADEGRRHHSGSKHRRQKRSSALQRLAPLDERRDRRRRSSNQSNDEEESYYEDQRRRHCYRHSDARYPPPPMAMMYLPPLEYYDRDRRDNRRRRHGEGRRYDCGDSSSSNSSSETDRVDRASQHKQVDLRSQRVRSLQAMAQLQRSAAKVIQHEYRFYRNRCRNRERLAIQLHARAVQFLEAFLSGDVLPHLVSETLLEVLRDQTNQQALGFGGGESALTSHAKSVYHELLNSVTFDVFQGVVDAMVREYMVSRLDMTRASQPPVTAVAGDILGELVTELVAEIIPDALTDLVQDYISWRHTDEMWQSLVHEELHDVTVDATVELAMESMLHRLEI